MFYFYVFHRVYIKIQRRYGFVVYPFMDFLGHGVACASFRAKILQSSDSQSVDRNIEKVSLFLHCYFEVLTNSYSISG